VPFGSVDGASAIVGHTGGGGGEGAITIVSEIVAKQPLASLPRTVNVTVPAAVGVPARTPAPVNVSPAGSAPMVTPNP